MAQPTNRINQLWNLPTKKLEKSHMFTICGNETATSYDSALQKAPSTGPPPEKLRLVVGLRSGNPANEAPL